MDINYQKKISILESHGLETEENQEFVKNVTLKGCKNI
jgi:hypothetical protein